VNRTEALALVGRLTPRQREVFDRLVAGDSAVEISSALGISRRTVQAHRSAISLKLNSSNLATFARVAIRAGVVAP